jgi:hypothetical protein
MVWRALLLLKERRLGPYRKISPGGCQSSFLKFRKGKGVTVFLVASKEVYVSVSLPCMIDRIEISDFRQEWTWIFREGVERESIDN